MPSGADSAVNTVPTGLPRSSPSGPASPVTDRARLLPVMRRAPSAMAFATGSDTAPYCCKSASGTPKTPCFTPLV